MKKFVSFILVFMFLCSIFVHAEDTKTTVGKTVTETVQNVTDGVGTVYGDATDAVSTVYGDAKDVVHTAYGDLKDVVEYLTPKLEATVISIANALQTGASEVFKILTRQQIVKALVWLTIMVIGLFCMRATYKLILKIDDNEKYVGLAFLMAIVGAVFLIPAFAHLDLIYTGLFNPKFGAIQDIVMYTEQLLGK